jgi:hypothetical protein
MGKNAAGTEKADFIDEIGIFETRIAFSAAIKLRNS